jgi:glycosyltransferase involved in cell wall biosynthesis
MLTRVVPDGGLGPDGTRHHVVVLTPGGPFADDLVRRGVPLVDLGMRPGRDAIRGYVRLVRLLRRLRPTMVLSWLYHADLLASLAAPLAGSPRVVWHVQGTLESLTGIPWHTRVVMRLLALLSSRPEAVAVNSEAGRRDHERLGYRPRRWVMLPNGFDTDEWRPDATDRDAVRAELGLSASAPVVVHVGRVHPAKDHATLLDAFARVHARLPEARLVCIGGGTQDLAGATAVVPGRPAAADAVVLALGDRDDVARLLRAADVAALSSRTEGLPNVIGEAMATALSCAVTDVGDCARLVGPTGRVVPPGDPEALADALEALLRLPVAQRAALGAAARERIGAHHGMVACRTAYRGLWS